ncbi:hypothetical protein GO013_07405 [Pseudodesulfovibrio sp. JC047]|uniref:hypothetical protein n=1 Tax=Pseudodesulfovibrio sp. JC047 TaxID=2683199 RepID=UPI0013D13E02|nr:hypothetical protein [Pseudodesulfovibrio sp. JC047]NDV19245.1 hypothetical protein [Pseudodesulfovibrio sp. JC047]
MATCKHKPCAVLPKFKGKSGTQKTSFYPAELWEEDHGGKPGLYRVMIGEKWHTRPGESVSFFTVQGIGRLILHHLSKGLDVEQKQPGVLPDIPVRTPVSYWPHDETQPTASYTKTAPFRDSHGEWRVWIYYKDNPILLADLNYREDTRMETHDDEK